MSSPPPTGSAAEALGEDAIELVRLVEQDLERHESTINEHHRTTWTIRGLGFTAVAGLVAVSYASFVALPGYFAGVLAVLFLAADYRYTRLYASVERRLPVLRSLSTNYRRLLARPLRSHDAIDTFRGDLRTYADGRVSPDTRPGVQFVLAIYVALALIAAASAWYLESHEKPGTATRTAPAVVCVGAASPTSSVTRTLEIVPCRNVRGLTATP